jgi:hypothetical protein
MKVKVGTVPKSNRKIIERGKMDTPKTTNTWQLTFLAYVHVSTNFLPLLCFSYLKNALS